MNTIKCLLCSLGILFSLDALSAEGDRVGANKKTTAHGDVGWFQTSARNDDVMLLFNDDRTNIVKRYRSPGGAGHHYKLWITDGKCGGFPVNLKTESAFQSFISHLGKSKNKHFCEWVENPFTIIGPVPTACGQQDYPVRCSTDHVSMPCPSNCAGGEYQTHSVNNPACPEDPTDGGDCSGGSYYVNGAIYCGGPKR